MTGQESSASFAFRARNLFLAELAFMKAEYADAMGNPEAAARARGLSGAFSPMSLPLRFSREEIRKRFSRIVQILEEVSKKTAPGHTVGDFRNTFTELSMSAVDDVHAQMDGRIRALGVYPSEAAQRVEGDLATCEENARAEALAQIDLVAPPYPTEAPVLMPESMMVEDSEEMSRRLRGLRIGTLGKLIVGDKGPKYRQSGDLTQFFADAGLPNLVHDGSSRNTWVLESLKSLDAPSLQRVLERLALRAEYDTVEEWESARSALRSILESEDLRVGGSARSPRIEVGEYDDEPTPPQESDVSSELRQARSKKRLFIIHGRNRTLLKEMTAFLRSVHLFPIEWTQAVQQAAHGSPYIGEVVYNAMKNADGVLVLFSPEEKVRLKDEYQVAADPPDEKTTREQPRPNVIFEAGMAFGIAPETTILVHFGRVGRISDMEGRNYVQFDGSPKTRRELIGRLRSVGLDVDDTGTDWLEPTMFSIVTS